MLKMKLSLFAAVLILCCLGCCYSDEPPLEPCTSSGGLLYIFDTGPDETTMGTKQKYVIWGSSGPPLDNWTPETPTGTSSVEDRYVEAGRVPVKDCSAAINAVLDYFRLTVSDKLKLEDDKKFTMLYTAYPRASLTAIVRNVVAG